MAVPRPSAALGSSSMMAQRLTSPEQGARRLLRVYLLPARASRLGSTTPTNRRMDTTAKHFRDGSGVVVSSPRPACAAAWVLP